MITKDEYCGNERTVETVGGSNRVTIIRTRWSENETASGREEVDYHVTISNGGLVDGTMAREGMRALAEALEQFGICKVTEGGAGS